MSDNRQITPKLDRNDRIRGLIGINAGKIGRRHDPVAEVSVQAWILLEGSIVPGNRDVSVNFLTSGQTNLVRINADAGDAA